MIKEYQFAASGSCFDDEKKIYGKVLKDNITFISDNLSAPLCLDDPSFWRTLRKLAKAEQKFIKLIYKGE